MSTSFKAWLRWSVFTTAKSIHSWYFRIRAGFVVAITELRTGVC